MLVMSICDVGLTTCIGTILQKGCPWSHLQWGGY
jgi:hypothetical protein